MVDSDIPKNVLHLKKLTMLQFHLNRSRNKEFQSDVLEKSDRNDSRSTHMYANRECDHMHDITIFVSIISLLIR